MPLCLSCGCMLAWSARDVHARFFVMFMLGFWAKVHQHIRRMQVLLHNTASTLLHESAPEGGCLWPVWPACFSQYAGHWLPSMPSKCSRVI